MKILSLDLGTNTGWATWTEATHIKSGVQSFTNDRFSGGGMPFLRFTQWLDEMNQIVDGFDLVTFEEVRRHAGTTAAHKYGGFLSVLAMWCENKKIPYQGVPVQHIKKHATGKGNARKEAVIGAMVEFGHDPRDDNEADALALLYYAREHYER